MFSFSVQTQLESPFSTTNLHGQSPNGIHVPDEANLGVLIASRGLGRQLVEVKTVDVLAGQQCPGIAEDSWGGREAHATFLRHHPDNTGRQQEHKGEPAVIGDTPGLTR